MGSVRKDVQRKLDLSLEELVDETKGNGEASSRKRLSNEDAPASESRRTRRETTDRPPAETEGARKTGRPPKPPPQDVEKSASAVEQQAPTTPKAPVQTHPSNALAPTSLAGRPPPSARPMGPPGYAPARPMGPPGFAPMWPAHYQAAAYAAYARPPPPVFRPPPYGAMMPAPSHPPPGYAPPGYAAYGVPPRAGAAPPVGVGTHPPGYPVNAPPGQVGAVSNSTPPPPPGSESSRSRRSDRDRDRDRDGRRRDRDRDRDRDRAENRRPPAAVGPPVLSAPVQAAPLPTVPTKGFQIRLSNIPEELTAHDLAEAFAEVSESRVESVDLIRDGAGRPTGVAVVIFAAMKDAHNAVRRYHGGDLNGRRLEAVYEGEIR